MLAHRVASTLYLLDRDYSSASDVASAGLVLARRHEVEAATDLSRTRQSLDGTLATALTHLHPPQHHARAQRLADGVLARSPDDIEALLAKAYIDEAAHRWEEARALFVRVQQTVTTAEPGARTDAFRAVSLSHDPLREAQSEIAWCDVCMGKLEEGRQELEELIKLIDPIQNEGVSAEERATAWWRLGKCLWEMDGEHRVLGDSFSAFMFPHNTILVFHFRRVSFGPCESFHLLCDGTQALSGLCTRIHLARTVLRLGS